MRLFASSLLSLLSVHSAYADTDSPFDTTGSFKGEYLCLVTAAGGVAPDTSGNWNGAVFTVSNERYVVKISEAGMTETENYAGDIVQAMNYTVKIAETGENRSTWSCTNPFTAYEAFSISTLGLFSCYRQLSEFSFNLKTLRFMSIYRVGYVDGTTDTPHVKIGECVKF